MSVDAAGSVPAAPDIKIQSLNQEEFLFSSAHGATVEWLTRFFVPPTQHQTVTLLRSHDRLILWPHQVVPPGDYRILLSYAAPFEASSPDSSAVAPTACPPLPLPLDGSLSTSNSFAASALFPSVASPPVALVMPHAVPASGSGSGFTSTVHGKHHRWSEDEEAYLMSLPANYSDWGGLSSGRFMSRVSPFAIRAKYSRLQKDAALQH
jgi:hypothetical protein